LCKNLDSDLGSGSAGSSCGVGPDQQEKTTFTISPYIFRLVWKADILMGQVKDQFPPPAEIDANSVLKGHTVDR
jgi:hypothetical protein